jgi:serine/threonine protein kinase
MQSLLKSLNYNNPNFYSANVQQVHPKIEEFHKTISSNPNRNQEILDIVSLLLDLTSSIRIQTKEDLQKETGHEWLFNAFLRELQMDELNSNNVERILEIFNQIANLKNQNKNVILVFRTMLNTLKNSNDRGKIDDRTLSRIIQAIRIDLRIDKDYFLACCGRPHDTDLKTLSNIYQDVQSRSIYRYAIESFLNLPQERFTAVLPDIQDYFE